MAYRQHTGEDVYNASDDKDWNEVKRIVSAQPRILSEKYLGMTSLCRIVLLGASEEFVFRILEYAEDVDEVNDTRWRRTIINYLACLGYFKSLRRAFDISTLRVNWQDERGNTPLHELLGSDLQFFDHLNTAKVLLDAGADISLKNKNDQTPEDVYVHAACVKYDNASRKDQKKEVLELLHSTGPTVPEVILARGPEASKIFKEELETGKIKINHGRLMVTGKQGVGKTSLVKTILGKPIDEDEKPTDGIVMKTAVHVNSKTWTEEHMDDCERTNAIFDNTLSANVAEKLKRKTSQLQTSGNTLPKRRRISEPSNTNPRVPKIDVAKDSKNSGNMETKDKEDEVSNKHESMSTVPSKYQKKIVNRMMGKEEEAVKSDTTHILDFAGQQLYYITHRIFLTIEAVYLIVFNLTEGMHTKGKGRVSGKASDDMTHDMTNKEIIKYWMRLIYTYACPTESEHNKKQRVKKPQIALVGTHSRSVPGTAEEQKIWIEEQFEIVFEDIKDTPFECHVIRKKYTVDNKFDPNSDMLNELKEDVGGFLKELSQTIPLKWLNLQNQILEIGKTRVRMSYDKVSDVASKCGILKENLIHALHYLHDTGIVLYFDKNNLLKKFVITSPRKLINIFKKIVTIVDKSEKWSAKIKLWRKLDNEGILDEELARHVWMDELDKDEENFDIFVEIMKQFDLLCEKEENNSSSSKRSFFVPCRLKHDEDSLEIKHDTDKMVSIYIVSDDFLPDSIFHPLVVTLIRMIQDMGYVATPKLFRNKAKIGLGLCHNIRLGPVIIDNKSSLKLEISRTPTMKGDEIKTPTSEPDPRVCVQILNFLKEKLKSLTSEMKHAGYDFRVLCWDRNTEIHFHSLEECLQEEYIRCDEKVIETNKLLRIFKNHNNEAKAQDVGYLSDHHLELIKGGIGREWKQLAVTLGHSWTKIKDQKNSEDNISLMLHEWRKKQNYETNQVDIMCKCLKKRGLVELASKICASHKLQEADKSACSENLQHHDRLSDIDLQFIAEKLGNDWKLFGSYLNLNRHEIDRLQIDYSPPIIDAILGMLVKWRENQEISTNILEMMYSALDSFGRKDIKEELQTYYNKKYNVLVS